MNRLVFWTLWERARVGLFERMTLKHIYYHMWNRSLVQVWCMIQGAQGWCTGMTQRDGMGRKVGGGFGIGITCTPLADSCQCMAKRIQYCNVIPFSSVQSLSRVQLFATSWITAHQASLCITNSQSLLKLMSIESVMPSSHLILCHPLLLLPPIPPRIRVFSNESTLPMRWPKYWSFSFSIIPFKEHPGLISFRMYWLEVPNK